MSIIVLLLATILAGLMAGVFFTYTNSVLPGLGRTDDRTFGDAMRGMNRAILNGWFLVCFLGTLVVTGVALGLHLGPDGRAALPWIIAGLALYAAVLAITFTVNVPLNNALDAGATSSADAGAVRTAFERRWVIWNLIRTIGSIAAFGSLAWALVKA